MGGGFSRIFFPCLKPGDQSHQTDLIFTASEPLDETLGHSFCYVPSSARFLSPSHSDRLSPSNSLRLSPSHDPKTTLFKTISGASVSANTSAPRTVLQHDHMFDDAIDFTAGAAAASRSSIVVNGFESTSSFTAIPLQTVPRGSGGDDRGFFMSGPISVGALSGPLDVNTASDGGRVHFSAPLGGLYVKRRRKKGISDIRKAFYRNFSDKKRPWVVPVLNFVGRKGAQSAAAAADYGGGGGEVDAKNDSVQWAHGKAGEDRVHVVVSEEHGWLFVGIYDGFNGPDAPEFLMGNLYRAVFNELQGLFWKNNDERDQSIVTTPQEEEEEGRDGSLLTEPELQQQPQQSSQVVNDPQVSVKRVTFQPDQKSGSVRKPLWEFLAENNDDDGLDLSGSHRFAFSVDDALRVSNVGSGRRRRSLLLSKLRHGFSKNSKEGGQSRELFPWRYDWEEKEKTEVENRVDERTCRRFRKRTVGPIDHGSVLRALSRALEVSESAYLEMTDKVLDGNPELALTGSCLLVVLMRDEDVYVMNVGDSRAIVAQYQPQAIDSSNDPRGRNDGAEEGIVEESSSGGDEVARLANENPAERMRLTALQLSTDHSTSIKEEVLRIKEEHPDDNQCIVNDRVKGRLKVTRAFGAGFLKQPKLNNALLGVFRNDYIGTAPYISCYPSLHHHKIGANDQFLVLSSDGLYQYFSNEEVVSHVENFMEKFPDGDPAQHLIEELLFRAAKKAGMDFHELLDIPQGDRRKYHDDVTVMVISLEGRIWKSSGKYL
ncbi:hypothetical protein NE237_025110 [Protea cynaroides]|uniref:PPM-type phosphatase domain-containing protein n=1 Tax=Protea cynaroides TaxID=273540 RepID=A0A9Q0H6F4_9MAGN|nr:hypothetical protein NE237_025110 [Protea cynaroides]